MKLNKQLAFKKVLINIIFYKPMQKYTKAEMKASQINPIIRLQMTYG